MGLILEIDIRERLRVVIAHDKASGLFLNRRGRREATLRGWHPIGPIHAFDHQLYEMQREFE